MRLLIAILFFFHFSTAPFLYASTDTSNVAINTCEINAKPESIFEYHFTSSLFSKLEINGNCITFFSEGPWTEIDDTITNIFYCRDCFSFIYRDEREHRGLHKDTEGLKCGHCHIKHKHKKYISKLELDYALWALYERNFISADDYRACEESFELFRSN